MAAGPVLASILFCVMHADNLMQIKPAQLAIIILREPNGVGEVGRVLQHGEGLHQSAGIAMIGRCPDPEAVSQFDACIAPIDLRVGNRAEHGCEPGYAAYW